MYRNVPHGHYSDTEIPKILSDVCLKHKGGISEIFFVYPTKKKGQVFQLSFLG